jgi:cytochrome c biogenesis protein CcdA
MNAVLLGSAAVLGLLGFFEPCTIATHTIFAVRANRSPGRWRQLALLFGARVVVLSTAFAAAAALGLRSIAPLPGATILIVLGAVYLLSIKVYLPVPHVQLYRLLPGGVALSEPLKLGLTLPACTLPLIIVVGLLAALSRNVWTGALAGLVFALMLTAPTIWFGVRGTSDGDRSALGKAAHLSHYFTTLLFWGGAAAVLVMHA